MEDNTGRNSAMLLRQGNVLVRNFPVHFEAQLATTVLEVTSTTSPQNSPCSTFCTDGKLRLLLEGGFFRLKDKPMFLGVMDHQETNVACPNYKKRQGGPFFSQVGFLSHPFDGLDYVRKEKYSLLTSREIYLSRFWGTWCGPLLTGTADLEVSL